MVTPQEKYYKSTIVDSIVKDIDYAYKYKILGGCIILILSAIDAMAALAMPSEKKDVDRKDFMNWTSKYMKTDPGQKYQYDPIDIYGARCGIVHRYSSNSDLSDSGSCKIFGYHDGSDHAYNENIDNNLVMISITRFKEDFKKAVIKFLKDALNDCSLKQRIESRLESLFNYTDAPSQLAQ